jgi:CspA family cold shock protein
MRDMAAQITSGQQANSAGGVCELPHSSDRLTGTLKWFDIEKNYGFILPDDDSAIGDVFVHVSALQKAGLKEALQPGARLSFELEPNPRTQRSRAVRLQVLGA